MHNLHQFTIFKIYIFSRTSYHFLLSLRIDLYTSTARKYIPYKEVSTLESNGKETTKQQKVLNHRASIINYEQKLFNISLEKKLFGSL